MITQRYLQTNMAVFIKRLPATHGMLRTGSAKGKYHMLLISRKILTSSQILNIVIGDFLDANLSFLHNLSRMFYS